MEVERIELSSLANSVLMPTCLELKKKNNFQRKAQTHKKSSRNSLISRNILRVRTTTFLIPRYMTVKTLKLSVKF